MCRRIAENNEECQTESIRANASVFRFVTAFASFHPLPNVGEGRVRGIHSGYKTVAMQVFMLKSEADAVYI